MPDRSHSSPDALHQIYALAAARWRFWDARRSRRGSPPASESGTRSPSRGVKGLRRLSATARPPGQSPDGRSPRAPVSASERAQALRLRKEGKTLREIGQTLNRSLSTVSRMLRQEEPTVGHGATGQRAPAQAGVSTSQTRLSRSAAADARARAGQPPTLAEVRELHNRIARLESSLTALSSALQALALTKAARGSSRRA